MTAFDEAFAISKGNMANVDFGHYVAAGNAAARRCTSSRSIHDRISSFHLKDRTTPAELRAESRRGARVRRRSKRSFSW